MGWLAIGLIAGTVFGVLVGVLMIGFCKIAREPREREDLLAQLERDRLHVRQISEPTARGR